MHTRIGGGKKNRALQLPENGGVLEVEKFLLVCIEILCIVASYTYIIGAGVGRISHRIGVEST